MKFRKLKEFIVENRKELLKISFFSLINLIAMVHFQYGFNNMGNFIVNNLSMLLITYIYLYLSFLILYLATSNLKISILIISIPLLILSFINEQKTSYLGEVFTPLDFNQAKEGFLIMNDSLSVSFDKIVMYALVIVTLTFVFIRKEKEIIIPVKKRLLYFSCFLALIYIFSFSSISVSRLILSSNIWDKTELIYQRKGFYLAFFETWSNNIFSRPKKYSKNNLEEIAIKYKNFDFEKKYSNDENKKNIIVILSEAFVDPYYFSELEYNMDPLEPIRDIIDEFGYKTMISPQFGGGTANVEYEVLTGTSLSLFPKGSVVYQQYLKSSHYSIPNYLSDFYSIGIHPYEKWFWRRDKVYPMLGFEEFLSIEHFYGADYIGPFVSDYSLTEKIILEYEKNKNSNIFIKAISMQNHASYNIGRFDENKIEIVNKKLKNDFHDEITEYINGIHETALSFKYLIDYFSKIDEETYIIFYGDHMPSFGENNEEFYKLIGYEKNKRETHYKAFTTPVYFWNNVSNDKVENDFISSFFLSKEILKYSNIELNGYFKVLDELNQKIKVYSRGIIVNDSNNLIFDDNKYLEKLETVNLISYDYNFGKKYIIKR